MRIALLLLSFGWVSVSWAQTPLQSPNGQLYQIADTTHGGLEGPVEFSGWPQLCVRVCAECDAPCVAADVYSAGGAASTPELNGRQLRTALQQHPTGLEIQRRIYVPSAGGELADGFVRYLDTLRNPQAVDVTVSVRLGTTSDEGGRLAAAIGSIWRTQSDDAALQPDDRWFVLDDNQEAAGFSATGVLLQGAGARVDVRRLSQGYPVDGAQGSLAWDYQDLRIPAGQTVGLLTIITQNPVRRDTLAELRSLQRVRSVDAIFGLTDAQRELTLNFDISPDNAAPVADAGGPYTVNEGMPLELSGLQSFDAEAAALEYAWDLSDDGQMNFVDADTANTTQTFPDNGVLSIALRVTDAGGKTDVDRARVQVLNVPPRIDSVSTSSPIVEGDSLDVEVRYTEPGADELTFDFDWDGDGRIDTDGLADARAQHRYLEDGVFNLRVVVQDDDGGRSEQVTEVIVRNVAPEILQVLAPARVPEGVPFVLQIIARDPGEDPITYGYDLDGDGIFERVGPGLDRVEMILGDDGLYPISVRICDDEAACTERDLSINVENVRPVIERIDVTTPINEGDLARLTVFANDVEGDPLTYAFDFDNDGDFADDIPGQGDGSIAIPFSDDGVYTVGVRVEDGDGGRVLDSVEVVVDNVAPFVLLRGPAGTRQGIEEVFTCQATDPGADRLVYDWDFDGDGQFELRAARAEERHTFPVQATIEIGCRVRDGDGGETVARHRIVVANERPTLELRVDSPQDEGTEVVIRAVAADAGGDELLYTFDFDNDGEIDLGPTNNPIARHVYPNQGFYRIRVVVTDGVDSIDASVQIQIVNRAPIVRLSSNTPINEGETLELTAEVLEPGADQVTLRWDLDGDGVVDPGVEDLVDGDEVFRSLVIEDDMRINVTVWADDGDGGVAEAVTAVNVRNLAPLFAENYFPPAAHEGRPYNRSIPASDPAGLNDPLRYSLVEPLPGIDIEAGTGLLLWVPTYSHFMSSPITLRVRIDDGDGGTAQRDIDFEVLPIDEDGDGLPDTYESMTCSPDDVCLDPSNPDDADDDPDMDGRDNRTEWAEGTNPFQFEGPELTELVSPVDGERVPTHTPTLVTRRAEDSRGEQVRIQFQVFRDADGMDELVISDPIEQPEMGDTSWVVPEALLDEDVSYWWRARVLTETAETRWTDVWRLRTNAENTAPTAPMPIAPPDGAQVDNLQPTLRVTRSTDADEDTLRYIFRVYDQTGEIFTTGEGVPNDDEVHLQTPALVENGRFTWDVVAIDEASAESEAWAPWSLSIDAENTVPTVPTLRAPAEDMTVTELNPLMTAGGSSDEDGDSIQYVFSVRSADGEILESSDPVDSGESGDASWTPAIPLMEDSQYSATVYALDDRGGVSETVEHDFFVSVENSPPPVPVHASPVDGGQLFPGEVILAWQTVEDPERGVVTYVVEFCEGERCTRTEPQEFGALNLSEQTASGGVYTWRVQSYDPEGMTSGPSDPWTFSVIDTGGSEASDGCGCDTWQTRRPSGVFLVMLLVLALGYRPRFHP